MVESWMKNSNGNSIWIKHTQTFRVKRRRRRRKRRFVECIYLICMSSTIPINMIEYCMSTININSLVKLYRESIGFIKIWWYTFCITEINIESFFFVQAWEKYINASFYLVFNLTCIIFFSIWLRFPEVYNLGVQCAYVRIVGINAIWGTKRLNIYAQCLLCVYTSMCIRKLMAAQIGCLYTKVAVLQK